MTCTSPAQSALQHVNRIGSCSSNRFSPALPRSACSFEVGVIPPSKSWPCGSSSRRSNASVPGLNWSGWMGSSGLPSAAVGLVGPRLSSSSSPKPLSVGIASDSASTGDWRSRPRGGRPEITEEVRDLIRRLTKENPDWGAPKIHGELQKLGFVVSECWPTT